MFSYEVLKDDDLIVLTSTGLTTVDDYQSFGPQFFDDVRASGIRHILVDSREDQGWKSEEAKSIAFYSRMESRSYFDRIAIVHSDEVSAEANELSDLMRNAGKDIRLFQPDQYDMALDWLKAGEDLATAD